MQEWIHWEQHFSFLLHGELRTIWCWYNLKCHHSNTFLSVQSKYISWHFCLIVKFNSRAEHSQLPVSIGMLPLQTQHKLNMSVLSSNQNYLISANTTRTWPWTSKGGVNSLGFLSSKFRGKRGVGEEGRARLELPGNDSHIVLLGTELYWGLGLESLRSLEVTFPTLVCSLWSEEATFKRTGSFGVFFCPSMHSTLSLCSVVFPVALFPSRVPLSSQLQSAYDFLLSKGQHFLLSVWITLHTIFQLTIPQSSSYRILIAIARKKKKKAGGGFCGQIHLGKNIK